MSTLELKELSHPSGEVIKIAAGKTLDLKSQGSTTLPTGSVLQVVSVGDANATQTTSTGFQPSSLSVTITPVSSSSKILIQVTGFGNVAGNSQHSVFTIYRGSAELSGKSHGFGNYYSVGSGFTEFFIAMSHLDSPSTTSATTYKVYFRSSNSSTVTCGSGARKSTITAMEIAG